MYKLHYTSGDFYIEKDGKKIKIANPELLPQYDILQRSSRLIQDGDIFTLPKELSVEIREEYWDYGSVNPKWMPLIDTHWKTSGTPIETREVAILSKSSSPEIPDSSEKNIIGICFEETSQGPYLDIRLPGDRVVHVKFFNDDSNKVFYQVYDNKTPISGGMGPAASIFSEINKFSLYPPSPPTVAGTRTENERLGNPNYEHLFNLVSNAYNEQLKTISDLRKRVKELETLLTRCDTTFGLVNQVIDNLKEQREVDPELLHVFVDTIDIDFELIQAKIKDELRTKP